MRKITIDFNTAEVCGRRTLGFVGEHNATELVIIPPRELEESEKVTGYAAAFTTDGRVIRSRTYQKGEELKIPLWQQLTQASVLGVQLEAFDSDGEFVGKSAFIPCLRFLPSADGTPAETDTENSSVLSEIAANTAARHTHQNAAALDKLELRSGTELLDLSGKAYIEHSDLSYRNLPNAHTIDAIKGLESELNRRLLKQAGAIQTVKFNGTLEEWEQLNQKNSARSSTISVYMPRGHLLDIDSSVFIYGKITDIGEGKNMAWAVAGFSEYVNGKLYVNPCYCSLCSDTPLRGVDYWTDDDKQTIINAVLDELPIWEGDEY